MAIMPHDYEAEIARLTAERDEALGRADALLLDVAEARAEVERLKYERDVWKDKCAMLRGATVPVEALMAFAQYYEDYGIAPEERFEVIDKLKALIDQHTGEVKQ